MALLLSDQAVSFLPTYFPLKPTSVEVRREPMVGTEPVGHRALPRAAWDTTRVSPHQPPATATSHSPLPSQIRALRMQRGASVGFKCLLTKEFANRRRINLVIITGLATFQD